MLEVAVNRLVLDKRKEYPSDDDMTYARREKALIIAELGEDTYQQWRQTGWGKQSQAHWGCLIEKLGELGT